MGKKLIMNTSIMFITQFNEGIATLTHSCVRIDFLKGNKCPPSIYVGPCCLNLTDTFFRFKEVQNSAVEQDRYYLFPTFHLEVFNLKKNLKKFVWRLTNITHVRCDIVTFFNLPSAEVKRKKAPIRIQNMCHTWKVQFKRLPFLGVSWYSYVLSKSILVNARTIALKTVHFIYIYSYGLQPNNWMEMVLQEIVIKLGTILCEMLTINFHFKLHFEIVAVKIAWAAESSFS